VGVQRPVIEWVSRHNLPDENLEEELNILHQRFRARRFGRDPGFPEFLPIDATGIRPYPVPRLLLKYRGAGDRNSLKIPMVVAANLRARIKLYDLPCRNHALRSDRVLFGLLGRFKTDFLKIDGSIIFNILRNPVDLRQRSRPSTISRCGPQTYRRKNCCGVSVRAREPSQS